MKVRKTGFWKRMAAVGMFALLMVTEPLTTLACQGAGHVEAEAEDAGEDSGTGIVILYDEQFVDEAGNIYPVNLNNNTRVLCLKHEIVSGYYHTHVKNESGGCIVKTYKSTQCIWCNTIWVGDLFSTTRFTKCTH